VGWSTTVSELNGIRDGLDRFFIPSLKDAFDESEVQPCLVKFGAAKSPFAALDTCATGRWRHLFEEFILGIEVVTMKPRELDKVPILVAVFRCFNTVFDAREKFHRRRHCVVERISEVLHDGQAWGCPLSGQ
jgi:hypothetical protein